ncbi:MAG: sugar phosphate isomerase/epimerase [Ruminococcaceae bacterium]|nr:sugar phosphate isomerase/epimerase [Oscillospiraceae bacterium]
MNNANIYAFADEACPQIDGQIDALLRNSLNGLEIRGVDGTNISDITLDKAHEVKSKLDAAGLSVFSVGSPIGKIGIEDDFGAHLDKFRHTLELASILGAQNMRIFSFYIDGDAEQYEGKVLERMAKLAEVADGSGVTLCHENEKGIFGDVPSRCKVIHENIPEIKAVFDPANFVQCGVDTLEAYGMLKNYIKYMHVKDSRLDGSIVPAGYGDGNIKKIVSDLCKNGKTCFTLEPHLTVFEGLSGLEREGEKSNVGSISFPDANTAFDAAVTAFDKIIGRTR